jgi:hypothetical protein
VNRTTEISRLTWLQRRPRRDRVMSDETSARPTHVPFHSGFVWSSLIMELGMGFLLGAGGSDRRPTRPGLPDYGEFGRFEWLIYAAYVWLVVAACGELTSGITGLLGRPSWVEPSIIRHLYLLGFITHLILGMTVRMLPGFMKKRRIASLRLVETTFWLGNAAMVCRVLVFLIPLELGQLWPSLMTLARWALGLSGLLGWAGVACLAVNLWMTAHKP